jgi:nicotinamide-nucleotide amidase
MLNAEIIAIGSELLTPYRLDTNSLWLTERLNSVGIEVKLKTVVGDDEDRLEEAFRGALARSEIIISTGGLGPTEDDITRRVLAKVTGRQLVLDYQVLEQIKKMFSRRGYDMAPNNERQALIPRGATVLPNHLGTAPGIKLEHDGKLMIILPGPPREMKPMFDQYVMPDLEGLSRGIRVARRVLKVIGLGESALDDMIAPIYKRYSNPTTTILFTDSDIEIHLAAKAESLDRAQEMIELLAEELGQKLGQFLYSAHGESLEEVVGRGLAMKGYTIATAESCTGGLLAERITSVPGASDYFLGGIVSYAESAKVALLGVPRELIERHGAVSRQVAQAMARGAKDRMGSTLAISVTGVAGPGGGTEATPVGTVYIGLADDAETVAKRLVLRGDRHLVRWRASSAALDMIRRRYLI